jgi:hypothetical protein
VAESRPTLDRLAELETLAPDADCPADARLSLPVADIRDLLALVPMVRAAEVLRDSLDHPNQTILCDAVCEAFEGYDHVRPLEVIRAG